MFRIPKNGYGARTFDLNNNAVPAAVTITGPAATSVSAGTSMVYDPVNDAFWVISGDVRHRLYGRFSYAPELRALVIMPGQDAEVRVIRVSP